jgi:hypothetical protein
MLGEEYNVTDKTSIPPKPFTRPVRSFERAQSIELQEVPTAKKVKKQHNAMPGMGLICSISAVDIQPTYQRDHSVQSIITDARR